MTRFPRVYLVRGDDSGWAIDEDRRVTRWSLEGLVEFADRPDQAEVIHACWWERLLELPEAVCRGRRVVCHLEEDPALRLADPAFQAALARVDFWIAQSTRAAGVMGAVTPRLATVPYAVDAGLFAAPAGRPGPQASRALAELADHRDAYVIANFQRDTLGDPLARGRVEPKLKKGPDLFVEILAALRHRGLSVVALLAGPRRHWVRARLAESGVQAVYAGDAAAGDDYPANILPLADLSHLYRAASLHLTCSRHEGGPRGVLEAAAAGVPQLSTPVGLAPDVLPAECLFSSVPEAVDRVLADAECGLIRRFAPAAAALVASNHTPEANRPRWRAAYRALLGVGPASRPVRRAVTPAASLPRRIGLWHDFRPPPYGGGNQFMAALKAEALRQNIEVVVNGEGDNPAGHVINSCWFDVPAFERHMARARPRRPRVVHRLDGPIQLYRRTADSGELDRQCMELNDRYADATVVQSRFTLLALAQGGLTPVRPVIVHNAADPEIFRRPDRPTPPPAAGEPLRVIASAWSDNPGKGAAILEWLDRHADPARVAMTFVGRTRARLRHARVVEALPSADLAALLADHHVYLAASRDDPCSNALIEAMACGLPVIYFDSGGHGELVQFGGLAFDRPDRLPGLLDAARTHLPALRRLVAPPTLAEVAGRYFRLLLGDAAYRGALAPIEPITSDPARDTPAA